MIDGATKAPHLLPKYVRDRLVLQEIAYQSRWSRRNIDQRKKKKKKNQFGQLCRSRLVQVPIQGH
jgi:hypothetical protein